MACEAIVPRYPTFYYSSAGGGLNLTFDAGESTTTGFNYQYGATCDNITSGTQFTAEKAITLPSFEFSGQNFCFQVQSVNDCAVSGWTSYQTDVGFTSVVSGAITTTGETSADTAAMPVSGNLGATVAFMGLGLVALTIGLIVRKRLF